MQSMIDLKQIERKAFRSTYQDGLWDMYMGVIVAAMAFFIYRPANGYSPLNIIMMVLAFASAYGLFVAGKKYITLPRMGQVRFGLARQKRKLTLAIMLAVVVILQAGFVGLTVLGWRVPEFGARIFGLLASADAERLVVAALGSLFIGPPMLMIAYLNDFSRGYYIAIMMALAVFLMILVNQPIYPLIIGVMIILPGLVLFIRFLKKYPVQSVDPSNE